MVHEKYIKRDGRVYGPYLYENYRVNGVTKTRYLGTGKLPRKKNYFKYFLFGVILLAVFGLVILSHSFFESGLTGRVTSTGSSFLSTEENIGGDNGSIRDSELGTGGAEVPVCLDEEEKELLLKKVVDNYGGEISSFEESGVSDSESFFKITGFAVSDSGEDFEGGSLQEELDNLAQELDGVGYGWLVNYTSGVDSVFYEDYWCNSTGYHIVRVLTEGAHHQLFEFGGMNASAHNFALNDTPTAFTLQDALAEGEYSWWINCSGNGTSVTNVSETRVLYIDSTPLDTVANNTPTNLELQSVLGAGKYTWWVNCTPNLYWQNLTASSLTDISDQRIFFLPPLVAKLSISDDSDSVTVYPNYTKFYANWTDNSDYEPGESINGSEKYCEFSFNKPGFDWEDYSPVNMSFNTSSGLYELIADGGYIQNSSETHIDGMPAGTYSYNITCYDLNGTYWNVSSVDGVSVSEYPASLVIENDTAKEVGERVMFYANFSRDGGFGIDGLGSEIGRVIWNTTDLGDLYGIRFVDLDNDGEKDEIVSGDYDIGKLVFFNESGGNTVNSTAFGSYGDSYLTIEVFDAEGDAYYNDVVISTSEAFQQPYVYVYNRTGGEVWNSGDLADESANSIAVGDLDNDGYEDDIVIGIKGTVIAFNSSGGSSWTQLWTASISGSVFEIAVGDLDNDGYEDDVLVGTDSEDAYVFDNSGGSIWSKTDFDGDIESLAIGDLDNDGYEDDFVLGSAGSTNIFVYTYDGAAFNQAWTATKDSYEGVYELVIADLDGDGGINDIVVGNDEVIVAYNSSANSGNELWAFTEPASTGVYSISVKDIDSDGYNEIIAGGAEDVIWVLSNEGYLLWEYEIGLGDIGFSSGSSPAIDISDINNDGINDIAVASAGGYAHILQEVNCTAAFDDSNSYDMTWNSSLSKWQSNRTFDSEGYYDWNVTCEKGGYVNQVSLSTIYIDDGNPLWSNNETNLTTVTPHGDSVYFNVTFSEANPDDYIFSWYNGTAWVNDSATSYTDGEEVSVIKTINLENGLGQVNWTWYFNDSFGNSNQTDEWSVDVDTVSPLWSNNETNLTVITLYENSIYFNITLSETNPADYIFSWYNGTAWVNDSATSYTDGEEVSVIKTIDVHGDTEQINWTWYINDVAGNLNQTDELSVGVDNLNPRWSNNETNLTVVTLHGDSVYFNVTFSEANPDDYVFSWYNGTAWVNDSAVSYTDGEEVSVIKTINLEDGLGQVNWTWYFNDSEGNSNQTDEWGMNVDTVNPLWSNNETNLTVVTLHGDSVYFNVTFSEANPDDYVFSWYNGTAWVNDSAVSYTDGEEVSVIKTIEIHGDAEQINWTLYFDDIAGNSNQTDEWSVDMDNHAPEIDYTTGAAVNTANVSRDWIFVNVSVSESNEEVIVFNLFNSSHDNINSTLSSGGLREINWTGLLDGIYYYNVTVNDTRGNENSTTTYTITLDDTAPVITIVSPQNSSVYWTKIIDFNVSVSENIFETESCWFSLDGAANVSMGKFNSSYFNWIKTDVEPGLHNVTFWCNDSLNNLASEMLLNFSVELADLTVLNVTVPSLIYSNATFIEINVSNLDGQNATNVNVSCYLEGQIFDSKLIAFIGGGSSYTTNCTLTTTSQMNALLNVTVDPANLISENNESNNELTTYINISQIGTLDMWDQEDDSEDKAGWLSEQEVLPGEMEYFFANYTMDNSSSAIENASCNVTFSGGGESGTFNLTYNNSASLYYYNKTFDYAGNYSWTMECSKNGFESLSGTGVERVRIPLFNQTSLGLTTGKVTVNYKENVNLSINLSSSFDSSNSGYNVSEVWANVVMPDTTSLNYSLSGSAAGGVWNLTYSNPGILGIYRIDYFANLTNGFDVVRLVESNFSVENTSIVIDVSSEANTTGDVNVGGTIRQYNGTSYTDIANNLFTIKLNGVLVSSNSYASTNFTNGTGDGNVNMSVGNLRLNLTSEGDLTSYSDDYVTTGYTSDAESYQDAGWSSGHLFDTNTMSGNMGNVTYKFSAVTEFYNASAYMSTAGAEVGGGNDTIYYSFDNVTWTLLVNTTSTNVTVGGTIPGVQGESEFYVRFGSDKTLGDNPISSIEINYTNYNYSSSGNYTSGVINLADVNYTTLKWDESLNGGTTKVQLRESDDGSSWNVWGSNYTSNLDNDITSFSKDYLQYRVWLGATNLSISPVVQEVNILYFNASTNSTGGYDYNVTMPADSLGSLALEVEVVQNPTTGIVGLDSTLVDIWAVTSVPYIVVKNYSGESNYSVHVNWTRNDTGALINGTFNITISNSTMSSSQTCSGVSQCVASWLVPTNLIYGNYTVNISAYNESAYYRNASASFSDYLEERNTTGSLYVRNKTIGDYSFGSEYLFYWNVTINNTGNASMSDISVSDYVGARGTAIDSVVEVTPCSKLYPGESCNATMLVTLKNDSDPDPYFISWRANWIDNDGSVAGGEGYINYTIMYVVVVANATMELSSYIENLTIQQGSAGNFSFFVNATGSDPVTGADISFVEGNFTAESYNLSSSWVTILPPSPVASIPAGGTLNVSVGVVVPAQTSSGNYTGIINVSAESGGSNLLNLTVVVPINGSWYLTPTSINTTKEIDISGDLQIITINNTGNVNMTWNIETTNSTLFSTNLSSLAVPMGVAKSFMVNYSTPGEEGYYVAKIVVESSDVEASPSQRNTTINMTVTALVVDIISPTASSPLENVTTGQNISILANATYGTMNVTNSSTWNVTINSSSCSELNSAYNSSTNQWNLSCIVPSLPDGVAYNLTVELTYDIYGTKNDLEVGAISYIDLTYPKFNITRNHINVGGNINLEVNVTDNIAVESVTGVLIYPNSSTMNLSFTLSGGLYINNSFALNTAGEYLVNYTANDSTGNENSSVDWFEVYDKYYWDVSLVDYASVAVADVNISLRRPNTTLVLLNNVTNASGEATLNVNRRFYDLNAVVSGDEVIVKNVNFSNVTESNMSFNLHRIGGESVLEAITLYRPFVGLASNSTELDGNAVDLIFNYSGYGYRDNGLGLSVIKCSVWNYADRSCSGSWSLVGDYSSRDLDEQTIPGNSTGFSDVAYFLADNMCGNGACETAYKETISTCSADCKETTTGGTTIVSGGGGGGGSGLTASDIENIGDIVKSFMNVGGINLETTSIYKELFAGDVVTVRIKLGNSRNIKKTIFLKVTGEVQPLIFFESNVVELEPNEAKNLIMKVVAPKSARMGEYNGNLVLNSGGEEGNIPVTIKILAPEGKLMDVKIQPLTPSVAPGGILRLQVDLLNLGKTKRIDVQFDLQLIDLKSGEIVARNEEAFAVETSMSVVKNMTIPDYIPVGDYMVKGVAYYSNIELDGAMQASSIAYVKVQHSFLVRKVFGIPMWVYLVILLMVTVAVGGYYFLKWREFQKKRFKSKVELSKLPQASPHSGFVGMVAETGIRTFIDMNKLQMHTLIAGATGSGKTIAAQSIIEEALLKKKSVIIFDPTAQWTGFLRKCEDAKMLKRYKYFGVKTKDAKAFDGTIQTIHDPYEVIDVKKYMDRPGEVTIFNISHLTPKEMDIVVASTIEQIFKSRPEEGQELKTVIVYDEVHRLLPKFGGSGQGFVQLERGAREFRKWGIGLFLISQVLSDFIGEVKANIGTEIQMGTRYEGDLDRVGMKYGDDVLKSVVKEPVGTGMVINAEYNGGRPYFVSFRPILHSTKRLSNEELGKYEKYFAEIEDLDYQILELKKLKVDVMDLELEIKLSKAKIKSGQFQMADMYLESLRPKIEGQWKKVGREPMHLVRERLSKEDVAEGIKKAKVERAKYIKKNPQEKISFDQEILNIKKSVEEEKKKGKNTSALEVKVEGLKERLKPFKGNVPSKDSEGIEKEIDTLKGEVSEFAKQTRVETSTKKVVQK